MGTQGLVRTCYEKVYINRMIKVWETTSRMKGGEEMEEKGT